MIFILMCDNKTATRDTCFVYYYNIIYIYSKNVEQNYNNSLRIFFRKDDCGCPRHLYPMSHLTASGCKHIPDSPISSLYP